MPGPISIGIQDYAQLIENNCFYVDKTSFIKSWWDNQDAVTLITRPRRFGKTLTMSMLDYFFSNRYEGKGELFQGLNIWKEEKFRKLQGTYPVIFVTFAGVKGRTYEDAVKGIKLQIVRLFSSYPCLKDLERFDENEKISLTSIREDMDDVHAEYSLNILSALLEKYYGKKVLIFLDEYDTPIQEAYLHEYWNEMASFIRTMFNNTFKTNPSMERAIMTGITRVSKESIFSDLNNLEVVTTSSNKYETDFGFTEEEVFNAVDELGYAPETKQDIKKWYDGFTFGSYTDIYNPWSIIHFLEKGILEAYWANTSENGLVGHLIQKSDKNIKEAFEKLLNGGTVETKLDEQIVYDQLDTNQESIWSLLLASGYLRINKITGDIRQEELTYSLILTNYEVSRMFYKMIRGWFNQDSSFHEFVSAMFQGDTRAMNHYMNKVALNTFSYFDVGSKPSEEEPEKFYHGFVLGLLVDRVKDYTLKSNRESGFGRYDVVLEPKDKNNKAVIMEFKVYDKDYDKENNLSDTADHALRQIEKQRYSADLISKGVSEKNILKYGFAFKGKKCLIKMGISS